MQPPEIRKPGWRNDAVAGREVEPVADQDVVGRLADPGEVLELVGGEQAVGARQRPALGEQRGEDEERLRDEHEQAGELEAVEADRPLVAQGAGGGSARSVAALMACRL